MRPQVVFSVLSSRERVLSLYSLQRERGRERVDFVSFFLNAADRLGCRATREERPWLYGASSQLFEVYQRREREREKEKYRPIDLDDDDDQSSARYPYYLLLFS